MSIFDLFNKPSVNAIVTGIIMYILITLSNMGEPILGSILASVPIGLLGLLAINNDTIRQTYISSAVVVNIIIVILWWFLYTIAKKKFEKIHILHAFIIWAVLCTLYYIFRRCQLVT